MPVDAPETFVNQEAADITAYLETWRVKPTACRTDQQVLYGERSLKLLTSYEYRNSVQDLFPSDGSRRIFRNHRRYSHRWFSQSLQCGNDRRRGGFVLCQCAKLPIGP